MCTREAAVVSSTGAWANRLAAFPSLEPERPPSLRAPSTLHRSAKWIAMTLLSGWLASSAIAAPRCADFLPKEGTCTRYNVSLVDLIANSEQFDGKRVVVAGFLSLEFEGHALYLHVDDFRASIPSNGIALHLPANWKTSTASIDCPGMTYVRLEGVYNARDRGHMGAPFSGSLAAIERCHQLELRAVIRD